MLCVCSIYHICAYVCMMHTMGTIDALVFACGARLCCVSHSHSTTNRQQSKHHRDPSTRHRKGDDIVPLLLLMLLIICGRNITNEGTYIHIIYTAYIHMCLPSPQMCTPFGYAPALYLEACACLCVCVRDKMSVFVTQLCRRW